MLPFSTHDHNAHKDCLTKERRLLGFAKNDDEELNGNPEHPGVERSTENPAEAVGAIQAEIGEHILSQESAADISKSPTVLLTLLEGGLIPDEIRKPLEMRARETHPEEGAIASLPARILIEHIQQHPDEDVAEALYAHIREQLRNPEMAVSIGHELEQRIRQLRDIEHMLESRPIDVERLEENLPEERTIDAMSSTEIRDRFGYEVESPTVSEKLEPFVRRLLRTSVEKTTSSLSNIFNIARRRRLHRDELGSIEELERHLHSLKQAVDNSLQEQARVLYENRTNRLDARFRATGLHTNATALVQQYGIGHGDLARGVIAPSLELPQRILREKPEDARTDETHDVAPETNSEEYLSYARTALSDLQKIRDWEAQERHNAERERRTPRFFEDRYLETARQNHADVIRWARETAPRLARIVQNWNPQYDDLLRHLLQNQSESAGRQEFRPDLRLTEEELERNVPKGILVDLHALLQQFGEGGEPSTSTYEELLSLLDRMNLNDVTLILGILDNPNGIDKMQQAISEGANHTEDKNTPEARREVGTRLQATTGRLLNHEALALPVSRVLDISEGLRKCRIEQAQSCLSLAGKEETGKAAEENFALAQQITSQLETCVQLLDGIMREDVIVRLPREQFESETEGTGRAAFMKRHERYEGKILVNSAYPDDPWVMRHERGHALLHILTEQTGLLDGLHLTIHSQLKDDIPEQEQATGGIRNFETILYRLGEEWGVEPNRAKLYRQALREFPRDEPKAQTVADEKYREFLMDELFNKYAAWDERRNAQGAPRPSADALMLFQHLKAKLPNSGDAQLDTSAFPAEEPIETQALFETGDSGGEAPSTPESSESVGSGTEAVEDLEKQLHDMEQNIESIRIFYRSYPETKSELEPYYKCARKALVETREYYNNGTDFSKIKEALQMIGEYIKPIVKAVDDANAEKLNLTDEAATGAVGWRAIARKIQFLSIMDIVDVAKQTWEDLNRIWKRRAEAKQAVFGEGITDWIPNRVPYAGRLKNEFRKRMHSSELEEVNHWKEALKESDSYALQDLLGRSRNRDQVRAIFELLSERGRLDWNDENMWHTLNALSSFSMPIAACENSDVLRDKWIQKLIADIWSDKDHYFNWRQANDSGINSGKSKFTPTVDQLANVGGMGAVLRNMLKTYVDNKGNPNDMPEEVNPHLYEELLHYAMRMGKMTMEGKFFYLIQGVRYGLLSIDRIRVLSGDGGGILNIFPFIDYFYQKNNSKEQVVALAERLDETKTGDGRFVPGLKTTMFVRMEIAREEAVKQRLRKGVSKQGENIDHDDIPYFLPELEYSGVEEWLSHMSGARQKLSKEALKNAYVGYSMKFKTFAALAYLDQRHIKRFSKSDVKNMAQTIGAYISADGILTRNGCDADARPWLSTDEINSQIPVMANSKATVKNYRDHLQKFTQEVLKEFLGDESSVWDEINRAVGNDPAKKDTDPKVKANWLTREDFARNQAHDPAVAEKSKLIFKATGKLTDILQNAMLQDDGEKFKTILLRMSEQDSGNFFIEDGAVPGAFSNETIRGLYEGGEMSVAA